MYPTETLSLFLPQILGFFHKLNSGGNFQLITTLTIALDHSLMAIILHESILLVTLIF